MTEKTDPAASGAESAHDPADDAAGATADTAPPGKRAMKPSLPHQMVDRLKRDNDFRCVEGALCQWKGTHWAVLSPFDADRELAARFDKCMRVPADAALVHQTFATALLHLPKLEPRARKDPALTIVPCKNGYLHIRGTSVTLLPPNRDHGFTYVLACDYRPGARAPRFERFIEQMLPDPEVRAMVQEYVGYTLTPGCGHQRAMMLLGPGANGKGVLGRCVQGLHGSVAAMRLDDLRRFSLSPLLGASLAYADEMPTQRIDEQALKSLIAGETVPIEQKYRSTVSTAVTAKWLVCANALPRIRDTSDGFWRRWLIVPCTATIPPSERDPSLADTILREELPGVLAWAIEGLLRLNARGHFAPPPAPMEEALVDARELHDSVASWIRDAGVAAHAKALVPKQEVYSAYRIWCHDNGMAPLSMPLFWRRLRTLVSFAESRPKHAHDKARCVNLTWRAGATRHDWA